MDKLDIEACKKENPFIVLADVIYKHLKNDIMQGLLLPGDKIVESKIAQQLDVSRTPVNIALNRALKDGWLERRSKRFLTVRKISPQECFYLYEARKFLEGQAAYLAAKRITKAELMGLKEILLNFRKGNDEPIDDELFCKNDIVCNPNSFNFFMYSAFSLYPLISFAPSCNALRIYSSSFSSDACLHLLV